MLSSLWLENIKRGLEAKKQFNEDALEGLKFYDGPHDWIFQDADSRHFLPGGSEQPVPAPAMKVTANRVFELVSIFGPMLYNRNPTVRLDPRKFPDIDQRVMASPEVAAAFNAAVEQNRAVDETVCAELQAYLNYIPNETKMRDEARAAVEEALIKGLSCLMVSVEKPPGGTINIVKPSWVSVDRLVLDPDAVCLRDVMWIAIECCEPTRKVEKDYNLESGYLKSHCASTLAESSLTAGCGRFGKDAHRKGKTYDMTRYWKIWTKIGLGRPEGKQEAPAMAALDELVGDYAYMAIAEGVPHPLNLPPQTLDLDMADPEQAAIVQNATSWQVPHWMDNAWPIELIYFHTSPNQLWPISHIKPALGEQYWLDWVYSLLATKVQRSCLTRMFVSTELDEDNEQKLYSNRDYEVLKVEKRLDNVPIETLIKEIHMGDFNPAIERIADKIEYLFAKRTGLLPFLYGQQGETQIRSAAEAGGLQSNLNIRPDDMREMVEDWITRVFRRMALSARYWIKGDDVAPILGKPHAMLWDQYVSNVDPEAMVREFEYRIEASNGKKPNNEYVLAHLEQSAQAIVPILDKYAQMNPENLQVLNAYMRDMAKAAGREWKYDIIGPPPPDPAMMQQQALPAPGEAVADQQAPPQDIGGIPPEMAQALQNVDPNMLAMMQQGGIPQPDMQPPMPPQQQLDPAMLAQLLQGLQGQQAPQPGMDLSALIPLLEQYLRPKTKRVVRDENGMISGIVEE